MLPMVSYLHQPSASARASGTYMLVELILAVASQIKPTNKKSSRMVLMIFSVHEEARLAR